MTLKYVIGVDLHGTLLDERWQIENVAKKELIDAIRSIKDFCKVYVCSGNDLTFVKEYVPIELRKHFDGYILETGCVISGGKNEKIIIP